MPSFQWEYSALLPVSLSEIPHNLTNLHTKIITENNGLLFLLSINMEIIPLKIIEGTM
jgi:hypothetical protein